MEFKKLTTEVFQCHDVWCWNEGMDGYQPAKIRSGIILNKGDDYFVKAKITFNNGLEFDGYIVEGCDDVYALSIFAIEKLKVNFNLPEKLFLKFCEKIENSTELTVKEIFPISYKTNYCYENGEFFSGSFAFPY